MRRLSAEMTTSEPAPVSVARARPSVFHVRGLTKVYGEGAAEVRALAGVDLDLAEGELVVLLGPSGSGKTTLLNNLGGLDVPTSGELWYQDLNLTAATETTLRGASAGAVDCWWPRFRPRPRRLSRS